MCYNENYELELVVDLMEEVSKEVSRLAGILGIPSAPIPARFLHSKTLSMVGIDCALVKGDNVPVLARFVETQSASVDFCYIDPPYNTGQSFIYDDSRLTGRSALWGAHSDWMGFMLPRLVLLKKLLKDSGIVAVSIDDYEYVRLRILLDCVFGEANHIATIVVTRSKNGKGSKAGVAVNHEYVLLYKRSRHGALLGLPEQQIETYEKHDQYGWYKIDGLFRKKGDASRREDRPNMYYPLYYDSKGTVYTEKLTEDLNEAFPVDTRGVERRWLWGRDKATAESWKLYASKGGIIYVKNYLTDEKRVKVKSTWDDVRYLTEKATNEVKEIFGEKIFETPKPIALLEDLIECCVGKEGLILDFFAGTGTTAHAAHMVNVKDGGSRRVILVEQNTPTPEGHISRSCGYKTLASITERRLHYVRSIFPGYSFAAHTWSS